jgi:hypothetical protein
MVLLPAFNEMDRWDRLNTEGDGGGGAKVSAEYVVVNNVTAEHLSAMEERGWVRVRSTDDLHVFLQIQRLSVTKPTDPVNWASIVESYNREMPLVEPSPSATPIDRLFEDRSIYTEAREKKPQLLRVRPVEAAPKVVKAEIASLPETGWILPAGSICICADASLAMAFSVKRGLVRLPTSLPGPAQGGKFKSPNVLEQLINVTGGNK